MPTTAPKATYSREEVRRLLPVTEQQLRGWERHGLIQHSESFGFSDLIALKTLIRLKENRIQPARIRQAVTAIRERLRHIEDPLRELRVVADGKRIHVEVGGQPMEPFSGQLLLNFDQAELRRLLAFPAASKTKEDRNRRTSAEKWFQKGLDAENRGAIPEAVQAYESAVKLDPGSAGAWLNLGTIFFNARQYSKAESHYRRALTADANYALAHFNIANLYDEKGDFSRALKHYEHTIRIHPHYADAHYNIALLHQAVVDPQWSLPSREEIVERYVPYVEDRLAEGHRLRAMVRHVQGLYAGLPCVRSWRRFISERAAAPDARADMLRDALRIVRAAA